MNKKITLLIIIISLFIIIFPTTGKININNKINVTTHNILDGAWLEERNGIKILYISGSNYEMGYQLGTFLKEPFMRSYRTYMYYSEHDLGITYEDMLEAWNINKEYIPYEYIEEMQGRADALNLTLEQIAVIDTLNQFLFAFKEKACSGFAAWGPATSDGKMYHVRSHDCGLKEPYDPETGIPEYENEHLIVRNPDNGYASISPTTILDVGIEGGFNEEGIAIGYSASPCDDNSFFGTPSAIRQLMVLDHAKTLDEAVKIINSNRTIGLNYIISDSNIKKAVIVEQSANNSYVGTWNSSVESYNRFWPIDHVVRRGNRFIDPNVSSSQTGFWYNEGNIVSWLISPVNRQYVRISREIERNYGKLDLKTSLKTIRHAYKYRYDPGYIFEKIFNNIGVWDQWVACPENGDMIVSFAQNGKSAYDSPIVYVNLFELLDLNLQSIYY